MTASGLICSATAPLLLPDDDVRNMDIRLAIDLGDATVSLLAAGCTCAALATVAVAVVVDVGIGVAAALAAACLMAPLVVVVVV